MMIEARNGIGIIHELSGAGDSSAMMKRRNEMKVLVAYDGRLQSKDVLRSWLDKLKGTGDELVVLHIFNSSRFIDYDAGPWTEEIARKESFKYVEDAKKIIRDSGAGARSSIMVGEGIPEDEIVGYADAAGVDILLCPSRCRSIIRRYKQVLRAKGKEPVESAISGERENLQMSAIGVMAA